jgi:hypothetical protein
MRKIEQYYLWAAEGRVLYLARRGLKRWVANLKSLLSEEDEAVLRG